MSLGDSACTALFGRKSYSATCSTAFSNRTSSSVSLTFKTSMRPRETAGQALVWPLSKMEVEAAPEGARAAPERSCSARPTPAVSLRPKAYIRGISVSTPTLRREQTQAVWSGVLALFPQQLARPRWTQSATSRRRKSAIFVNLPSHLAVEASLDRSSPILLLHSSPPELCRFHTRRCSNPRPGFGRAGGTVDALLALWWELNGEGRAAGVCVHRESTSE
ncbi:uncharacterized protein BKA78DRAFT_66176 [Phyllosticta capitalensis]|uniref:Uncharacterized protein n=1 Tax=Phyllosticta capitalensis TaxID=121624 RepID=A0ABR1YAL8_9PEZI